MSNDEKAMRDEYDFSEGERRRFSKDSDDGSVFVLLDPDVAKLYPTSEAVNRALRAIAEVAPKRS